MLNVLKSSKVFFKIPFLLSGEYVNLLEELIFLSHLFKDGELQNIDFLENSSEIFFLKIRFP